MGMYLIFGAEGSVGRALGSKLHNSDHFVVVCPRGINPTMKGTLMDAVWDVSDRKEMEKYSKVWDKRDKLDGIVYAVGHCPPNGFAEAIKHPLSQLPFENYLKEINMHQVGVLNVFQCMLEHVKDRGCFLFLSSAITRLKGQFPPFLQVHYHVSVIAAEDWLIDGMRHDPMVKDRKIKIHRIAPAAMNTPFHQGGPNPSMLIPISIVVEEIILALESQEDIDKQIV